MKRLRSLVRDRRGATAIEYGLICALIFLASVGGVRLFAAEVIRVFTTVSNQTAGAM